MGERITSHANYVLYHIGETQGHNGVGFLIKKHMAQYVEEIVGISERIAILKLNLPNYKDPWSIVQVYSPTEKSNPETINSFYHNLNKAIQEHAHKNLIVMGDFNGQLGARRAEENTTLGPYMYCDKIRSRNGEKITNFALENNLTVLNTVFKKNKKNMWTWISPDGKTKNEIDFIMTNRNRHFNNFSVINKLNFNTNHRLIRAELSGKQTKNPRPRQNSGNAKLGKHQMEQLTEALRDKFKDFKSYTKDLKVQEKYNWIENTIKTQAQVTTYTKIKSNTWLTTTTKKLLEERNKLISTRHTQDRRKKLTKISKEIRENIRKDRKRSRFESIEKYTRCYKKAINPLRG
ncbi:hypothetical protein ABMA27_005741 [Loxostege sticticalis]|uniref:Endonuclease/exonuclease/phosphatase domain-containing protein n=1 Tax=Loxostege sticticalis TaxID=481309 RepID=A0ABR3HK79_LOXSC